MFARFIAHFMFYLSEFKIIFKGWKVAERSVLGNGLVNSAR
jgi:hypothetical protein